jgi:hypothetical protein
MAANRRAGKGSNPSLSEVLEILTPKQVLAIDRALTTVGPFGEVRLVKVKGKVRFIQQLRSDDLLQIGEVHG